VVALLVILRPVCWVIGHRWEQALLTFGRALAHCGRCGAIRYQ
jgi:hypothetical protein